MRTARVAVLGGGRSSEHEVSLASAASVRAGLEDGRTRSDRDRDRPGRHLAPRRHPARGRARTRTRRRRRRVPGAARAVRRGRHGPGAARVPRRALRGRRRARVRAVHGQGDVQGADGPCRAPAGPLPGGPRRHVLLRARDRAVGPRRTRAAGVRQAGAARLVGRDRPGRDRVRAAGGARDRVRARLAGDRRGGRRRPRGRVLGDRRQRSDRVRARRDRARGRRVGLVRLRGQVQPRRDAADRARPGPGPRPRPDPRDRDQRVPASRAATGSRGSTSSSTASGCC